MQEIALRPRKVLRWLYLGRLSLSAAIFLAAVSVWLRADRPSTLIASLAFSATMVFTAASVIYSEIYNRAQLVPTKTFIYIQIIFDLLLVTSVVHVTWDVSSSQFASLYILVIAISALLLSGQGVVLVAALGSVFYIADSIWGQPTVFDIGVWLQMAVFGIVALGSGYIAMRLRASSEEHEVMAAELAKFRLRQADVDRLHLRAERLEAVAELSASLAHEIKNPLASIRSAVEQLSRYKHAGEDERTLGTLVMRESDRLSRLLSEFLDFARVDVTRVHRQDLVRIARDAATLANSYPDKPADVRVECSFASPRLFVDGDDDLLHRAMFNLILNAVQSAPSGSVVRVEGGELTSWQISNTHAHNSELADGAVAVQVIDNGPGIPESVRDRIFHPFVTTKPGGSGLGLAIVHRAIEAHRGLVTVDTNDKGTRFTIVLPKAKSGILSGVVTGVGV